jgi:hypothetical protein
MGVRATRIVTRHGSAAAVISLLLLGGCAETQPATDIGASGATVHSKVYCPQGLRGAWRYAYREVGAFYWQRTPDNRFSCSRRVPASGPMDLPVEVTGLSSGARYEYRFEVKLDDGRIVWWDGAGRAGGTGYDRFSTTHPEVTPVDAAALRDSIGVNVHLSYFDTAYNQADLVGHKLRELGVRHVRQSIYASSDPRWRDWNDRLYSQIEKVAARGIKFNYGLGLEPDIGTVRERLAVLAGRLAGTASGLEGPNEPDLSGSVNWAAQTALFTPQVYFEAKYHVDPTIRRLPVAGPSFGTLDGASRVRDLSPWVDYGNFHPYTGCTSPDPTHLKTEAGRVRQAFGDKPLIATEAGFHTALNVSMAAGVQPPCDERTAAVYTLRTLLEHFKAGIRRTFLYELIDYSPDPGATDAEKHFGLLRNDFSAKPAFAALKNLIAVLGTGSAPSLAKLRLEVEQGPWDLRVLTLRRADGSYLVVLWRLASVWNRDARTAITVAPQAVRLSLPDTVSVRKIEPMSSTAELPVPLVDRRVSVGIAGDPVVLRLTR